MKCVNFLNVKKTSLKRWIDRYEKDGSIIRHSRKSISYKVTNVHVKYAIKLLKQNEQITLEELSKLVKKKYKDFDITSHHAAPRACPHLSSRIGWPRCAAAAPLRVFFPGPRQAPPLGMQYTPQSRS